jgi:CPA1 family monovalent cation:H+ antiporter
MEPATREAVQIFWQIAAFIGNSIAFLLIGFQANIVSLPQSVLLIIIVYAAVLVSRAVTVYPIFAFFRKIGGKSSIVWSNIALLGGVRGALSIALAATITTSVVISQTDLHTISTLVFGVAFVSILVQVPILFRYTKKRITESEVFKETPLDSQFIAISSTIEQLHKLRLEGKISDTTFAEGLDESKKEIENLIAQSRLSLKTKKILQARVSSLFPSRSKRLKLKEINEEQKNGNSKSESEKAN